MYSEFRELWLRDHQLALERNMHTASLLRREDPTDGISSPEPMVLRLCCVQDGDNGVLDRLAGLEGRETPKGPHVLAEVGGVVVAALPLGPGDVLADPFSPTAHLIPLLELRASHLTDSRVGLLRRRTDDRRQRRRRQSARFTRTPGR
jgi:hypothetical protein